MHDTAFSIGGLALNLYANLPDASILEVGAQAFNGSLREHSLPSTRYVGLDISDGEGVDVVVKPGQAFPFDDESFDMVLASSVFEHDPAFWLTFVEMCRKTRAGGYVYVNAPSNGAIHRYPKDNWRFYPDAGVALAKWAASQGQHVSLVESFTAKRDRDIWNDFVAVFRKGPIVERMPKTFLYEHVPSTNVITWRSEEPLLATDETQDMTIIRECRATAEQAAGEVTTAAAALAARNEEKTALEAQFAHAVALKDVAEAQLALVTAQKAAVEAELAQVAAQRVAADAELAAYRVQHEERLREQEHQLHEERARRDAAEGERAWLETQVNDSRAEIERQRSDSARTRERLAAAEARCSELERRSKAHFDETATLSRLLLEREQQLAKEAGKVRRLRAIHQALASEPRSWAVLPRSRRLDLQRERLRRLGLFDGRSYLEQNPDVAAEGLDPLYHYVAHGIDEARQF